MDTEGTNNRSKESMYTVRTEYQCQLFPISGCVCSWAFEEDYLNVAEISEILPKAILNKDLQRTITVTHNPLKACSLVPYQMRVQEV